MNRREAEQGGTRRVAAVAWVVLCLFAAAAYRAVYLQVFRAPDLRARSEDQRVRKLKLLSARGAIFDRNRRELAVSIPGASVFVDPSTLLEVPRGLDRLCKALSLDSTAARERLEHGGQKFGWLKRQVSPAEEEALRALKLPGVGIAREARRFYPNKALAGQTLGFVGLEQEGLGGLEFRYDDLLRGRDVWVKAERDARGGLLLADAPDPTEGRGKSLVLTLDDTIQHIAEEELAKAVEGSGAKEGTAVCIDPSTGEILALAHYPGFNPNSVSASRPLARKLRATSDVYEPGSTFKTLFLGALLEQRIVCPTDMVFCENGAWTVNRKTIHDHSPHGWLSVKEVLKVSSNIGVAKLSERIAPEAFCEGLRRFGIGSLTGVDLPGESKGILPPARSWSKITAKTVAFGQGVSATAIQVASALAAIGNQGVRMRPHIVSSILDENGVEVQKFPPEPIGSALSPEAAGQLTRMMESVVQEEGGTAPMAAIPGYTVAGKTGTAWKANPAGGGYLRDALVTSFMGFVPSRSPRVALLVIVDEPTKGSRYGGTIAAPAFREMASQILSYLQVAPEAGPALAKRPSGPKSPTAAEDVLCQPAPSAETARGSMPDVRGLTMREALRRVQGAGVGVRLTVLGSGVAAAQEPVPGWPLADGQPCRLVFRPLL